MVRIKRIINILIITLTICSLTSFAGEHTLPKSKGRYVVILPKDYDAKKHYDLVVALHGMGDNADHFAAYWQQALGGRSTTVIAVPAPGKGNWSSDDIDRIIETTEDATKNYSIDPHRVYLTGFSAGCAMGFGVLCKKPGLFNGYGGCGMNMMRGFGTEAELSVNVKKTAIYFAIGKQDLNHSIFQTTVDMIKKLGFKIKAEDPNVGHTLSPEMCQNMLTFFDSIAEQADIAKLTQGKKLLANKSVASARKILVELSVSRGAPSEEAAKLLKDLDKPKLDQAKAKE